MCFYLGQIQTSYYLKRALIKLQSDNSKVEKSGKQIEIQCYQFLVVV